MIVIISDLEKKADFLGRVVTNLNLTALEYM